jgi:DivIVA domain-containing protein
MEMSPKAIAAVTFPVVRKGYDPEQVRSFLSQLSRGVEELQNRALQAEAKARLTTAAPGQPEANVESITKTLVLAQRTADATLAEARQEAEGIRRQATERAESTIAEARAQGAQIINAAEQEAVRSGEVTRARIAAEVDALEARRQALSKDADALSGHITSQRERMAATVEVLTRALEHPDGLQEVPSPVMSEAPPSASYGDSAPVAPASRYEPEPAEALPFAEAEAGEAEAESATGAAPAFPAPTMSGVADPITQEVPMVREGESQAWSSFFDAGPTGDDRWKR